MQSPPPVAAQQPFPYGWRYVQRTRPDGTTETQEVALTLEDVLHPQEDDVIPERPLHELERGYLASVLRVRVTGPRHVHVCSDQLIDWGVPSVRDTSPDVTVFVGLAQEADLDEGTFHLGPSKGRCLLVVEIVSPHTRSNDVERKPELYHQVGVPLYVLIDQQREGGPRRLVGYTWGPQGYEELPLDEQGRLVLGQFGLALLVRTDRLVCLDARTGQELGDYAQVARELDELKQRDQEREREMERTILRAHDAEAKARDEAQARTDAEARARDEARARADAEAKARDEAKARTDAEARARDEARARADAETRARDEAQARTDAEARASGEAAARELAEKEVRELRERLRLLQNGG
jgi:hypothetical protein